VLFAIGSAIERHDRGEAKSEAAGTESGGERGGETAREASGEAHRESPSGRETHKESSEDIFGVNPEAKGLVAAAVATGVVLAGAVWTLDATAVLLAVIVFGLVFALFDIREIVHQVDESRAGLVVIAAVLAVIHLAVATMAGTLFFAGRQTRPATRGG
jgi:hypothetical protein